MAMTITLCTVIELMQCTFSFIISKYELRQITVVTISKERMVTCCRFWFQSYENTLRAIISSRCMRYFFLFFYLFIWMHVKCSLQFNHFPFISLNKCSCMEIKTGFKLYVKYEMRKMKNKKTFKRRRQRLFPR